MPIIRPLSEFLDSELFPRSEIIEGRAETVSDILESDQINDIDSKLADDDILDETLTNLNLVSKSKLIESKSERATENKLSRVLNYSGASVESASRTISDIMRSSKYDNCRLRAAEMILDMHGVRDEDGKVHKQPIFQFLIKDSTVNLNRIFSPQRAPSESESLLEQDNKDGR